ncbi:hypothetical protein ARMSODRAFT_956527, partial [Armillaria solidipes]
MSISIPCTPRFSTVERQKGCFFPFKIYIRKCQKKAKPNDDPSVTSIIILMVYASFSVLAIRHTTHYGMLLGIPRGPGCKMKAGSFKVGLA